MAAMSVVEGSLEAVNSYDDAHLSFGIFQWTAGGGDAAGEIAALLAGFKEGYPDAFENCFGRFGLDATLSGGSRWTGFLTLDGASLTTSPEKDALRKMEWA